MKQIHKVSSKVSRGLPGDIAGTPYLLPCSLLSVLGSFLVDSFSHPQPDVSRTDPPCSVPQTSQCMWLMQALGFLLSALQVEEILKNLHSLISPYIQQLEKLAEEIVSES